MASDLLAINRDEKAEADQSNTVDQRSWAAVAYLSAQLDFDLILYRFAAEEMTMLTGWVPWQDRELWSRPFLSPRLARLAGRGVRARCYERLAAPLRLWSDHPDQQSIRLLVDAAHREILNGPTRFDRVAERIRGWVVEEGDWNLWYYQACMAAVTMEQPPERKRPDQWPAPGDEDAAKKIVVDPNEKRSWTTRNDEVARTAVIALNRSVANRPVRGQTAIEAGIQDWMLYQDPDLDRLRPHPRFRRWAEGTFEIDEPDQERREVDRTLWLLCEGRRKRTERLVRLTSEAFTELLLRRIAERAASFWLGTDAVEPQQLWTLFGRELTCWRSLVGVPRMIEQPRLRVTSWASMNELTGSTQARYPGFLTSSEALRSGRPLDLKKVTTLAAEGARDCHADLERCATQLRRVVPPAMAGNIPAMAGNILLKRAHQRWWRLLNAVSNDDAT